MNIHTLSQPTHLSLARSLARMHELLVKCTHTYERINRVSRNFMENRRGSVFTVLRVHFISDVYGHLLLAPDHPRQRIQTSILLCTRARERERKKSSVTQAANLENQLPVPSRLSFHPLPFPLPKKTLTIHPHRKKCMTPPHNLSHHPGGDEMLRFACARLARQTNTDG